jgi:hypothetical protein
MEPGRQAADVQRGLAHWMSSGKIDPTASTEELLAKIEEVGLVEFARIGAELAAAEEQPRPEPSAGA